ncbi:MAG TPA: hypothetical protein PKC95_00065 [Thauera aminoaromatica]|nr:hypothetical protein [Thauera aminoaromatica]
MTDLARLVVKLTAQTAEYEKKLDQANGRLARFERNTTSSLRRINQSFGKFNRALGAIGLGVSFVAITRGLAGAAARAIEYGDEIAKASAKTGVGAQAFSELAYAAKQNDIELTALSAAFKKMQVSISEANSGGKSARETFAALGLEFEVLKRLAPDRQFEAIADRISQLEDPADRTRAAVELFGRAGADLLPMFEQGAAGIRLAREEAQRFGASLTEEQVARLAAADDAIKRMKASWEALARTLTAEVAPNLTAIFDALANGLSQNERRTVSLAQAIDALGRAFKKNGVFGTSYLDVLKEIQSGATATAPLGSARRTAALSRSGGSGVLAGAPPGFKDGGADKATAAARAVQSASDEALGSIEKMVTALEQQVATFNQGEAAALAYRITQGDLAETFAAAGAAAEPYKAQLLGLTTQLVDLEAKEKAAAETQREHNDLVAEAAALIESLETPWDQAGQAVDRYNLLLEKGLITQQQFDLAMRQLSEGLAEQAQATNQATEVMSVQWDQALRNMQDVLGEALFNSFEDGLDGMAYQWAQALKRMAAEALAANIFGALTAGLKGVGGGGGLLSGLLGAIGGAFSFGGGGIGLSSSQLSGAFSTINALPKGYAEGGFMRPHSWGLVGERGPELAFAGPRGMTIEPIDGSGKTRPPIVVNMHITTPDAESFRRTETQIQARMQTALNRASLRKN